MRSRGWRQRALVRALPYLRPYRHMVAIVVTTSILSTFAYVALPLIVKVVIDGPLQDGDRGGILRWCALAGGLATVELFLSHTRRTLLAVVSTNLETSMRDDLYAQMQA